MGKGTTPPEDRKVQSSWILKDIFRVEEGGEIGSTPYFLLLKV